MMLRTPALFGVLLSVLAAPALVQAADRECAQSPGKVIEVCVFAKDGGAFYEVSRGGKLVLAPAPLGLTFAGEPAARITALTAAKRGASDTSWEQPWGEQRTIRDNHSELTVSLAGDTALNKTFDVTFRLFDDGLGFRYAYGAIPAGHERRRHRRAHRLQAGRGL
jgi:alpha-glucosidase